VRDSARVTLERGVVRDADVGVRLDRATGCEILDSEIRETETAGILLAQSLQNGIRGNTIRASGETGVCLTESGENAVTDNDLRGGSVAAIALRASPGNLVESNRIREASDGIRIDDASSNLILRNSISARSVNVAVTGSADCRILQNRVSGGPGVGIAASTDPSCLEPRRELLRSRFRLGASTGASVRRTTPSAPIPSAASGQVTSSTAHRPARSARSHQREPGRGGNRFERSRQPATDSSTRTVEPLSSTDSPRRTRRRPNPDEQPLSRESPL
jgi:parallel beta-helix repeat protein